MQKIARKLRSSNVREVFIAKKRPGGSDHLVSIRVWDSLKGSLMCKIARRAHLESFVQELDRSKRPEIVLMVNYDFNYQNEFDINLEMTVLSLRNAI